jgi:transposase-like protein
MIHFILEGESTMVLEPVECPVCGGTNVIKHGKSGEGKQRYLCQDPACHGKTFIRDYSDLGRLPQVKEQIIEMSLNGSGIRDIARVLKISPTTVIEEIKKRNRAERYKYRFAAPA